jgi:hypothetical protein
MVSFVAANFVAHNGLLFLSFWYSFLLYFNGEFTLSLLVFAVNFARFRVYSADIIKDTNIIIKKN